MSEDRLRDLFGLNAPRRAYFITGLCMVGFWLTVFAHAMGWL